MDEASVQDASNSKHPDPPDADHPEEGDPLLLAMARARGVTPSNSKPDPIRHELTLEDGRKVKAPKHAGPTHTEPPSP